MKILSRATGIGTAAVLVAAFAFAAWPTRTREIAASAAGRNEALAARGRYLAAASDCTACHTVPGGRPFAGGLAFPTPIGAFYSSNITPDRETGIGGYSLDQFDRALRHGLRPDGSTLVPAMPYPSYAHLTDEDVRALYAYFMDEVAPVRSAAPPAVPMRWSLAFWRRLFAPDPDAVAFDAARYPDAKIARGAYLVQGPGHCGACHTPRAPTLQEKALDESGRDYLAGGQVIDGWLAVNLRGDAAAGLGRWSEQDIVDSLRTGRNAHAATIGTPMSDVVEHSMQHLDDDDLHAIAADLKTLPPAGGGASRYAADDATAKALRAGVEDGRGAALYLDNCAGCHRSDAQGYRRVFPAIAGNPSVLAADPQSLVRLILAGSALPSTTKAPSALGMPGFAWRLRDEDVAQLATYVRNRWGNHAPAVDADEVGKIRRSLKTDDGPAAEAGGKP